MIYVLLGFYLAGGLGNLWKRASLSAASPHTPWMNVKEYVSAHGGDIIINFALSLGLFITVWRDTAFLSKLLLMFGFHQDIEVPLNPFTAGIYGVFSESLMDLIIAKIGGKIQTVSQLFGAKEPPSSGPTSTK
jgi:hypothetical protein